MFLHIHCKSHFYAKYWRRPCNVELYSEFAVLFKRWEEDISQKHEIFIFPSISILILYPTPPPNLIPGLQKNRRLSMDWPRGNQVATLMLIFFYTSQTSGYEM